MRADTEETRIAILSDTHGVLDARIERLSHSCDLAIHGGDVGNADVLARLQPLLGRVYAVRGNNDVAGKWPERDQDLLGHLPEWIELDLPGGTLALIHGHQSGAKGRHARLRRRFPHARAIVYGHSHRLVVDCDTSPWILNPGAAGRTRTYGGSSCLVLTARESDWMVEVHRFPIGPD